MGTRSRIGIELSDHSVLSVYCHWDGYPEHNGRILWEHYRNREDVQDLINGGGISSLRTRGTWNHSSPLRDENGEYIHDIGGHLMYKNDREPQPLYYSERGEEVEIHHGSFQQFISGSLGGEEYAYLFDLDGNWKAYTTNLFSDSQEVEIPDCVTA